MSQLVRAVASPALPALIAVAGERASRRFLEFFAANIRNPHTRRAYPGCLIRDRSGAAYPAVIGHLIGVCDQVGRLPDEVRGTRE
jgi:hypothetical protein